MANDAREKQLDALTDAISRVLTPVMICMLFAIWLVHSLGDGQCSSAESTRPPGSPPLPWRPRPATPTPTPTRGNPAATFSGRDALIFVGIFCVLIVVFTYLVVFLFRRGYTRVLGMWVVCAVALIFSYVGGVYLFEFSRTRCINLDWVSLTFGVWNFAVVGLVSIFWSVPRFINQTFLIVMSALMAFIFRTLPGWATWTILVALVVWDLFAVLAPFGPLGMLVNEAKARQEPLPALVYDTNPNDVGRDAEAQPPVVWKRKRDRLPPPRRGDAADGDDDRQQRRAARRQRRRDNAAAAAAQPAEGEPAPADALTRDGATASDQTTQQGVGTLGTHLKLGLGDFVFYSILVAQASNSGAMTAITSFVAILAGLCATLFLVVVYRKPLPALPISIVAGILFFFLTRYTVFPFVLNLMPELLFH